MKKVLVVMVLLGLSFSAFADHMYEVQINGGFGGTSGGIAINDEDRGDNSPWSLGAEVYKAMGENLQIGGVIAIGDEDTEANAATKTPASETTFTLGVLGRYNFDADHSNSMFAGGGLTYNDLGNGDSINIHLQFGKRYALSDNITYTPNVSYDTPVSGEYDNNGGDVEGSTIMINFLSFSGFM